MEKSYEIEIVERLTRMESLTTDINDLKTRMRRLEIGLVILACSVGGLEAILKAGLI